ERYRLTHEGQWPASLDKLVPKLLVALPLDPTDGEPLRYRRLDDGVVIYSVGADKEGATFDPDGPSPHGVGLAVRLWDVQHRRQPPPPEFVGPLLPDEPE